MLKQTLGWTIPKLRSPEAADRWTWLLLTAYTQLRLTRDITTDLRAPGRNPDPLSGSPAPGSAEDFGTCVHNPPVQPVSRNPPGPAPDAPPDCPTTSPQHATTSTPSPAQTSGNPNTARTPSQAAYDPAEQVKTQAKGMSRNPVGDSSGR